MNLRSGAAAVEFAIVSPIVFLMAFGAVEFGRAFMAQQAIKEAARLGCRRAILDDAIESEVEDAVEGHLQLNGIANYSIQILPNPLESAAQWDLVTITVTVSYDDIAWLNIGFLGQTQLGASCSLPREGSPPPE